MLTSQPGTLYTCENAHVNTGGEIEKRLAFVEFADVGILDDNGDTGTFGLLVTEDGITVFGSAVENGAAILDFPELVSAIPAGVTFRTLIHPYVDRDDSSWYNRAKHRMTAVVFAENYNGKSLVAATFADGNTFLYYDSDPTAAYVRCVKQSAAGIIGADGLNETIAALIEDFGWQATEDVDEEGNAQTDATLIESPQKDYFDVLVSKTSDNGRLGVKIIEQDKQPTTGTKGVAGFQITVNTGTFTLEAPSVSYDTTPTIDLCGGAIAAQGSIQLTCEAIARAVNDFTNEHGYTAIATTDSVFVYAPYGYAIDVSQDLTVTVTTGTVAAAGSPPTPLAAIVDPIPLEVEVAVRPNRTENIKGEARCTVSGGVGGYTFLWTEATSGSGDGIQIGNSEQAIATFSKPMPPDTIAIGSFKCLVRDNAMAEVTVYLTVTLRTTKKKGQ